MIDSIATAAQKARQGYDASTPRCATCLYFKREPRIRFHSITAPNRRGVATTRLVPAKKHPVRNPTVDRCTFGNFETCPQAACDEWRTTDGEVIAKQGETDDR